LNKTNDFYLKKTLSSGEYDDRSEIWGVGIAAYEMARGKTPFSEYPP